MLVILLWEESGKRGRIKLKEEKRLRQIANQKFKFKVRKKCTMFPLYLYTINTDSKDDCRKDASTI